MLKVSTVKEIGKKDPNVDYSDLKALADVFLELPKYRFSLTILFILSVFESVLGGASLSLLIPITQGLTGSVDENSFITRLYPSFMKENTSLAISIFGAVFLAQSLFSILRTYLSIMVAEKLRLELQKDMVFTSLTLSLPEIIRVPKGVIIENTLRITDIAAMFVLKLLTYLTQLVVLAGLLVALLLTSPKSFVVLVVVAVLSWFGIGTRYFKWSRSVGRQKVRLGQNISEAFSASLAGIKEIKLSDREPYWISRICEEIRRFYHLRVVSKMATTMPMHLSQSVIGIALFVAGIYMIYTNAYIEDNLPLIIFLATTIYRLFKQTIVVATSRFGAINNHYAFELIRNKSNPPSSTQTQKPQLISNPLAPLVSVRNLSFSYNDNMADAKTEVANQEIFKRFNFELRRSEIVAIFGPSGSGKTTLIDLIAGLYEPEGGEILVEGQSISEIDPSSWRKKIGYVPQQPVLFRDSLRENIRLGREHVTDEKIIEACRTSCITEMLKDWPNGLDTIIEEAGANISGGQLRRIAVARAIVGDPSLVVLDEAASSLEESMEKKIIQNLKNHTNAAILIISHRATTQALVDRFIKLEIKR